MSLSITRKLEMAARVQEWQRVHPPTDRNQVAIVQRFEALLAKAQALFLEEHAQRLASRAVVRNRGVMRRGIERQLRSVARIGAFATRSDARAATRFTPLTTKVGNANFVAGASSLLQAVREHQDALVSHGLTKAQLNALAASLARFSEAMAEEQASRQHHAATRAALQGAVAELLQLVGLLDAFHRERFDGDARMLGLWRGLTVISRAPVTRARRSEVVDEAAPESPPPAPPLQAPTPPATNAADPAAAPDGRQDRAA